MCINALASYNDPVFTENKLIFFKSSRERSVRGLCAEVRLWAKRSIPA